MENFTLTNFILADQLVGDRLPLIADLGEVFLFACTTDFTLTVPILSSTVIIIIFVFSSLGIYCLSPYNTNICITDDAGCFHFE